jgi:hypothetical protein
VNGLKLSPAEGKERTMPPRGVKKGSKRERQYKHIEMSKKELQHAIAGAS